MPDLAGETQTGAAWAPCLHLYGSSWGQQDEPCSPGKVVPSVLQSTPEMEMSDELCPTVVSAALWRERTKVMETGGAEG